MSWILVAVRCDVEQQLLHARRARMDNGGGDLHMVGGESSGFDLP